MKPANTAAGAIGLTKPKITPNAKTVRRILPTSPSQAPRSNSSTGRFGASSRAARNPFGTTAAAPPSSVETATVSPKLNHSTAARTMLTPACASKVNGTTRSMAIGTAASYCAEPFPAGLRPWLGRIG